MGDNNIYLVVFSDGRLYPCQHIPPEELFPGENVLIFAARKNLSLGTLLRWYDNMDLSNDPDFKEIKRHKE
jgi:hypothetical protein